MKFKYGASFNCAMMGGSIICAEEAEVIGDADPDAGFSTLDYLSNDLQKLQDAIQGNNGGMLKFTKTHRLVRQRFCVETGIGDRIVMVGVGKETNEVIVVLFLMNDNGPKIIE